MEHLDATSSLPLLPSPWIEFGERGVQKTRWCQPDGLLLDPWGGRLVVLEIKYQHTAGAWWQLMELYAPVLRRLLPEWRLDLVEVCKWYDPAISFPVRPRMLASLEDARDDVLGVHILKP